MTRIQSPLTNLGVIAMIPSPGSITAATQFANNVRGIFPLTTLTPTSEQEIGDFGTCLVAGVDYGKLMILSPSRNWINATPASNLAGYIQALQIQANSITANQMAADSIVASSIAALALDGKIITGSVIRTAASGARVEINSTDGLKALDASGNVLVSVSTTGVVTIKTAVSGVHTEITSSGIKGYDGSNVETFSLRSDGCWAWNAIAKNFWVDTGSTSLQIVDSAGEWVGGKANILGINVTNTLGASGIIDGKTNAAKIAFRDGPSFVDAANPPTMTDGETLVCACSGNSKTYYVHRTGTNYFYSEAYGNALPPILH